MTLKQRIESGLVRCALIDMDGTLYDSMPLHVEAWSRLLTRLGIAHDRDELYLHEGMTGTATLKMLFRRELNREITSEEAAELYCEKTRYFNELTTAPPMPGAADMLNSLQRLGINRVLVTGSGQRTLIDRLQRDFPGTFTQELMITSADVKHGKPDPEPYLIGMQRAGVAADESIVIENAPLGVEAGARSGAFTIGVTTGPIKADALYEAGADEVFDSMEALADMLANCK